MLANTPWWGAITIGMIFFTGVARINGWVMDPLAARVARGRDRALFGAFKSPLVGCGWLGNPLFLLSLTGSFAFFSCLRSPRML